MSRIDPRRWASLAGGLAGMGVLGGWSLLRELSYAPGPVEPVSVVTERAPAVLRPGDTFTLLSWNLQFAASRKHHFFYDGGDAVHVPLEDVLETTAAIRDALVAVDPDVALLQEVDREADRTGHVDQLHHYMGGGRWCCRTSTPYHRSRYVPHPKGAHMGRVDLNLAVLSRFALEGAERIQLPRLKEPWLRQVFNLKRALLHARIPVEGAAPLRVGNTHLSAFSHGDGTLSEQVAVLDRWMRAGDRFVLAGDFNLLPPGDDAGRLGEDGALYADARNPMEALLPGWPEAFGPGLLEDAARTYLPYGAERPDRKIDYVFHGAPVEVVEARVLREYDALSDHLPVWVKLRIPR